MSGQYHTGQGNFSFDTPWGRSITKGLEQLAKSFDLSFEYGVAPHDFTLSRFGFALCYWFHADANLSAPYPSNNSVLSLMTEVHTTLLPRALANSILGDARCSHH
jgi:hypothetical protein